MTTAAIPQARRSAGYTVIELLVVLAILAAVAGLVAPSFVRPAGNQDLMAATIDLAASLRLARAAARAGNAEQALVIDLAARRYWAAGVVPPRAISPALDLVVDVPDGERLPGAAGRLRFFADGSASGGTIGLRRGNHAASIVVDWLNGDVRVAGLR